MLSPVVPDLRSLEVLEAVERAGSLRAAAAVLGVTQQAVSLRVRSIERQVGLPLVLRGVHGSGLTPAGRLLTEWGARVLSAAAALEAGISTLRSGRDTQLKVAASMTIAEQLLPRWLLQLAEQPGAASRPAVEVHLEAANSDRVAALVLAGQADVGFVEGPRPPRGLRTRVVSRDELLLVVGRTHPWATRRDPVGVEELAGTPLIAREQGSGTRQAYDRALRRRLPALVDPAVPLMELANVTALRATIASGLAPGFISDLAAKDDLTTGRLVAIAVDLDLRRDLRAVWASSASPPAGPARDLVQIARRPAPLDR